MGGSGGSWGRGAVSGGSGSRGVWGRSGFRVGSAEGGLISVFREFSASVGGAFFLAGAGCWAIILCGFENFLIFSNFLRS